MSQPKFMLGAARSEAKTIARELHDESVFTTDELSYSIVKIQARVKLKFGQRCRSNPERLELIIQGVTLLLAKEYGVTIKEHMQ